MVAIDQTIQYAGQSALQTGGASPHLALACATDADDGAAATFLSATVCQPAITARGLRAVSEIVGSRFYIPPSMLARILREADPIVTVGPDSTRFEGFSACCSTFARLDLDDTALEIETRRHGTTNVDFGPKLRGALASVAPESDLRLTVGADAVTIAPDGDAIIERKVPLPVRWIRGFGEVQLAMAGMEHAFDMPRIAAQRFLRAQPRSKSDHLQWVSMSGGTVRTAAREVAGAIPLRGPHRLAVLEPLMAQADRLSIYANTATGATAWMQEFGSQRLTVVLNLDPWRGFSGDGGLLSPMQAADDEAVAEVRAQLHWQSRITGDGLSQVTGLSEDVAQGALAQLAALGLVGFDLVQSSYFHRVLPFDAEHIARLNPRLAAAEALVGAVTLTADGGTVRSDGAVHRISGTPGDWRCTCPWYARHGGDRGPCKHILAVEMAMEQQP